MTKLLFYELSICQVITRKDVVHNKLQGDFLLGSYL